MGAEVEAFGGPFDGRMLPDPDGCDIIAVHEDGKDDSNPPCYYRLMVKIRDGKHTVFWSFAGYEREFSPYLPIPCFPPDERDD